MRKSVIDMDDSIGSDTREEITQTWNPENPNNGVRMYFDMPVEMRTHANTLQSWW